MKLAAWNVNSLKVRLPHLLDWLASAKPDVVCLQELKLDNPVFPVAEIEAAGYQAVFNGQKTYNGVAILSRHALSDVVLDIPGFADEQKRVISATLQTAQGPLRVVCAYCPNGQSVGSDKYDYKLRWYAALTEYLRQSLLATPQLAILGDYNIAPDDRDVHDPAAWKDQVLCSAPERAAFQALLDLGLHDSFRLFEQEPETWSWWDYRMNAFKRRMGLRIDHVLISDALRPHCRSSSVDSAPRALERPSDHAPVIADLAL